MLKKSSASPLHGVEVLAFARNAFIRPLLLREASFLFFAFKHSSKWSISVGVFGLENRRGFHTVY